MKSFDTVKFADLLWRINYVNSDDPKLLLNDESCFGMTYFEDLNIYVNIELSKVLLERTIRHELCHAALFSYGFDSGEMEEESICNFMEVYGADIVNKAKDLAESVNCAKQQENNKSKILGYNMRN